MKKLIQKDKQRRVTSNKFEKKRFILKSIIKNINLLNSIRWNAVLELTNLPKNSSKMLITNRCIVTGRKGRYNKRYKFSRLIFLRLVRSGLITGVKKATW